MIACLCLPSSLSQPRVAGMPPGVRRPRFARPARPPPRRGSAPTPGLLMHVRLPTHMRALTQRFGSPDRIVLPVNIEHEPGRAVVQVACPQAWRRIRGARRRLRPHARLRRPCALPAGLQGRRRRGHLARSSASSSTALPGARSSARSATRSCPGRALALSSSRCAQVPSRRVLYTALFFSRQGRLIGVSQGTCDMDEAGG